MKLFGLFLFLAVILLSNPFTSQAFADVISPKQQMNLDFTAEQIICSEGLVKITKASSGNTSCVKPVTAEKLSQMGWAKKLTEQKIEEIKTKKIIKGESAGTIKKLSIIKQLSPSKTSAVSSSISGYVYIFDACANAKVIRTPEIFVTSDSETKQVKLGSMIKSNSCYASSVLIKAANPESISATMLNKGGISEKISSLESQIADLKSKITIAKQSLSKTDKNSNPETINNVISLKKELNDIQDQLRRYLMVLYVPPSTKVSKIDFAKSITGQPLTEMRTDLISVTESVVKPISSNPDLKRFNVVFEACSGTDSIRTPLITINSDSDSVDIKLIDRIIPKSCQVGIGKINAVDSQSIMTKISENSNISSQISSLEKTIDELQIQLGEKRSSLGLLVSKQLDSSGEEDGCTISI